jgi:hypothetical protein
MASHPRRIHCSYHKCLTVYFGKVMNALFNRWFFWSRGFHHFNSRIEEFYEQSANYTLASVNNHCLDLDRIGDCRITRFVRDPRDLIVSGYFYHKRAAEAWCDIRNPSDSDWMVVNGTVPNGIQPNQTFAEYLQSISKEDGLIAEIDFRHKHFESMIRWPNEDPRILTLQYEKIIGAEQIAFRDMLRFYGFSPMTVAVGVALSKRYSAEQRSSRTKHIRNPQPNQWKEHFTPRVEQYFLSRFPDLLAKLGY